MPKRSAFDAERLRQVLRAQHHVITRQEALLCGLPPSTLDRYIAPGGRWQRLLPGVYLAFTGAVTQDQREMAALLYAGPRSLITGSAAVRHHRLSPPGPNLVDVLIPWTDRRQSTGFVRVHRTRRMPARRYRIGMIRFTKAPRAVADTARSLTRFDDVRHVVPRRAGRSRRWRPVGGRGRLPDPDPELRSAPADVQRATVRRERRVHRRRRRMVAGGRSRGGGRLPRISPER